MRETRVLIVDDEEEFAATLAERLVLRGYRAEAVFTAAAGLAAVRAAPPDVVLLDLMMPGVRGLDTLRAIRETAPSVEVIVLTGYGGVRSEAEGMEMGAFDYLMKPVDITQLAERIDRARARRADAPGGAR